MAKISDIEFQAIVRNEIEQALGYYDTEFSQDRIDAMDYYLGEPFGNEQPDRSQVVSTEVSDTIEHIMPNLMRIFASSDEYVVAKAQKMLLLPSKLVIIVIGLLIMTIAALKLCTTGLKMRCFKNWYCEILLG